MSNIFFTSDEHYMHTNIIKYQNRPFKDIYHMNESLIENHNNVVGQYDVVYHLGDFSFQNPLQFTKRLNGKHYLIRGNHCYKQFVEGAFVWVKDVFLIKSTQPMIFMSHYAHRVWPHSHHGAIHLYGHSHDSLPGVGRSMDVGVDANDYKPVSLDEVVKRLTKEPYGLHHERSV